MILFTYYLIDVLYGIIQQINPLWTKREGHTLDLIMYEAIALFLLNAPTNTLQDGV